MDDLSEFFKRGIQKNFINQKSYQQKTLRNRMEDFNNVRRQTRTSLMYQKRKIDVNNMSPFITPSNEKIVKKPVIQEEKKPNKRLEMLYKWKAEKEKRKQEDKQVAKPVFKVPGSVGLPSLDKAQEIKGKPIKPLNRSVISKFAPRNHIFKPPSNINPINFNKQSNLKENEHSRKIQQKVSDVKVGNGKNLSKTDSKKTIDKVSVARKLPTQKVPVSQPKQGNSKRQSSELKKNTTLVDTVNKKYNLSKVASGKLKTTPKKNGNSSKTTEVLNKLNKTADKLSKTEKLIKASDKLNNTSKKLKETPNQLSKTSKKVDKIPNNKLNKTTNKLNKTPNKTSKTVASDENKIIPKHEKTRRKQQEIHKDMVIEIDDQGESQSKHVSHNLDSILLDVKTPEQISNKIESDIYYNDDEITLKTPRKTPLRTPRKTPKKSVSKVDTPAATALSPNIEHTPVTSKSAQPPIVYISPFITISRGKESARKEYKIRQSTGGALPYTPDTGKDLTNLTSPTVGALYFSKKLDEEISRIENLCAEWNDYKNQDVPEDINDLIDTAVGQSKLLIAKKFKQFRDLIIQCRDCQYKEKPVTCMDLHGFWDTMYMQVEDIDRRFGNLKKLKDNNWQEFINDRKEAKKSVKARPTRQTKIKAASKIKDMIKQARAKRTVKTDNQNVFTSESLTSKPSNQRLSTLQLSAHSRKSASPGLTMMKITQAIKQGDGVTPSSILKKNGVRSERRMTKCVLFKDLEDAKKVTEEFGKENVNLENIDSTPQRRSRRRSIF